MKLIGGTEMKRLSDNAVEIIHDIHTNGSDHQNEFLPLLDAEARLFDAASRLALYGEAGLEPEECRKLAEAKKEGRLVVLPVPVGEGKLVYGICDAEPLPAHIVTVECDHLDRLEIFPTGEIVVVVDGWEIGESDIGETVFLTREEAEAAMKGDTNDD